VSDPGKRYVDIIKRNTDRLINIVQDLLLLSELEEQGALHLEEIDVAPVLENILRIFDDRLREKHLSVKTDIGQGVPRIKADPFKLEQVFVNLIDNAIKYTEKGEIAVRIGTTGSKVIIEVHDSGIGIPRQDLRRVFERFYVVDKSRSRKFGGTGLGLSIVKHIVLLHNGSIDVDSTPGTGTTFTVTLPVDPAISS
jgi:two-component system phosphate regulon sensor histidine kinase PhoR